MISPFSVRRRGRSSILGKKYISLLCPRDHSIMTVCSLHFVGLEYDYLRACFDSGTSCPRYSARCTSKQRPQQSPPWLQMYKFDPIFYRNDLTSAHKPRSSQGKQGHHRASPQGPTWLGEKGWRRTAVPLGQCPSTGHTSELRLHSPSCATPPFYVNNRKWRPLLSSTRSSGLRSRGR